MAFTDVLATLTAMVGTPAGRPPTLAVDGRSSSGKTTLARRIAAALPGTVTVHRPAEGPPLHRGESVSYRPPAWLGRGRAGSIDVPADAALVVVEGVGAGRREVRHLLDAVVYVQVDLDVSHERNAVRVAAGEADPVGVVEWMAEEMPFVEARRPWEGADLVVAGSDVDAVRVLDAAAELVVGTAPARVRPPGSQR